MHYWFETWNFVESLQYHKVAMDIPSSKGPGTYWLILVSSAANICIREFPHLVPGNLGEMSAHKLSSLGLNLLAYMKCV